MRRRGYLKQFFDVVVIFLFFYGLIFSALPIPTSKFVWAYLFIRVVNKKLIKEILQNKMLKYCFAVWVIISIHYLFMMILRGNYYPVFLRSMFWYFSEGIFGAYLLYRYLADRYEFRKMLSLAFLVVFIQSLFIILTFISVPLRELINTILLITDERGFSSYRMKGLSNFGGASLSYLQMIGVVYGGILLLVEDNRKFNRSFIMVCIFLMLISQIFVARTGLVASIVIMGCVFLQQAKNRNSVLTLIRQFSLTILAIIVLLPLFIIVIPDDLMNTFNDRIVYRNVEAIENYESSGTFTTSSTENLKSMYFLPDSEWGIIFGEALWDENVGSREYAGRLVDSDVGYVRVIFAVGLIVAVVMYSIYLKYIRDLLQSDYSKYLKLVLWTLLGIFILGELKEPFLVRPSGVIKVLFFMYFTLIGTKLKIAGREKEESIFI